MSGSLPHLIRPRVSRFDPVIVATGSYAPPRIVTNDELSKMVDTTDEWIVTRTGIRERRLAAPDQATSHLGAEAARRALAAAGLTAEDVDMIVCATITPDMGFPNTGCLIQQQIGASRAFCFDLEAACSGFVYALEVASQFVASGTVKTALVLGAEKLSSIIDWKDRATCVLFGDGAGAAVIQGRPVGTGGVIHTLMRSDGRLADLLKMPGGGSRHPASVETVQAGLHHMMMDGREVFKNAVQSMTSVAKDALKECGLTVDDVKLIIPHQANMRIVQAIGDRLGGRPDQYFINLDRYGNTSAASVILALDEAVHAGKLQKGDLVLLVAFGGGFTWGASIVEWANG